MKIKQSVGSSCAALALAALAGCATTSFAGSRDQMESTVYDTHRRVVGLDATIKQLAETAATLTERVTQSDENTRRMISLSEENQRKIDTLQKDVTDLKSTVYRHFNLTPPKSVTGVTIDPPATSGTPVPVSSAPESGMLESEPATEVAAAPAPEAAPAAGSTEDPQAHYQKAQRDYANGEFQKALTEFDEHLRLWPGSDTASNALFWKAKCNLKLGDNRSAVTDFEQLRKDYTTSTKVPFAMHNQAVAHSNLGEKPQAEALLEEVIANYPVSPAAEQAKVDLQRLRGQN
jgi:tol-pal system protein YbgF